MMYAILRLQIHARVDQVGRWLELGREYLVADHDDAQLTPRQDELLKDDGGEHKVVEELSIRWRPDHCWTKADLQWREGLVDNAPVVLLDEAGGSYRVICDE